MEGYSLNHYRYEDSLDSFKGEFETDYFKDSFDYVLEYCAWESVKSVYYSVFSCLIVNIGFGVVASCGLPKVLFHLLSAIGGIYILLISVQSITGLSILSVTFLTPFVITLIYKKLFKATTNCNNQRCFSVVSFMQYTLMITFVSCEYFLLDKNVWLEIRGIMMIFSMKLFSLLIDLPLTEFPSFLAYSGYMLSCGNILFGPWISFEHYMLQVEFPTRKNLPWVFRIIKSVALSVTFLTISNCWASHFIGETDNNLLEGYKQALTFRASHYFVSYLSEAMIIAAGWKNVNEHFNEDYWQFPVTNFLKIEFPLSLATVITNWNKPMHEFLKKYVYRKLLPSGKFSAVLITFAISSIFHGCELNISIVLIGLGIFSYFEMLVREHISQAFNVCLNIHPCKSCEHAFKRNSVVCRICLSIMSFITVLHLIFLGVLMDETAEEIGIYQKWSDLSFCSLWILFISFLIVK